MPTSSRPQIKKVFDNINTRAMNKAQREITMALPGAAEKLRDFISKALADAGMGSMTGNTLCSSGVGIYRDGSFIACATTSDMDGKGGPIHMTLKKGDTYPAGSPRYDGSVQIKNFRATEGEHNFYANQKVVSFLKHYPPTRKKGISYRFVMYLEYNQLIGQNAMLMMADEIENRGGEITTFHLGGGKWDFMKKIRTK